MGLLRNKLLWTSVLGIVLAGVLLLLAVGYLGVVVYAGLASGASPVAALLDVAVPAILGVGLLVVLLVVAGVTLVWTLVRHVSLSLRGWVVATAERLERAYPPLRILGLSELFAPALSADERSERALADLKRRYVDDELTEAEFERQVDRLVAGESLAEGRATRGRRRVVEDHDRH